MANPADGSGRRTIWGRFMEAPKLLRTVEAPGDLNVDPATVEAVSEYLNTKERVAFVANEYSSRAWAKDNLLHLQCVCDATVTGYDIEVFVTLTDGDMEDTDDRWAYIYRQAGFTRSQIITLEQVPMGQLKGDGAKT